MKYSFLLIPFLFFFLIFFIPANAYTIFTPNPTFNTNASYAAVYSSAFYNPPLYQWSSSCYGLTGCLNITTDNLTNIQVLPYDQDFFFNTTNNSDLTGHDYFLLPKNEEGLAVLQYRASNVFYGFEGYSAIPKLYIVTTTPTYQVINSTDLIPLNGTWYNYTVIVPATTYDRNISMDFGFSSYQPPTEFDIHKFKFYTLDAQESTLYWIDNATEINHFCGNNSIQGISNNGEIFQYFDGYFYNDTMGYLMANDSEGFSCWAFKIGGQTIARRQTGWDNKYYSGTSSIYYFRDLYFVHAISNTYDPDYQEFLVKQFNLNSWTIATFTNKSDCTTGPGSYPSCYGNMVYNGNPNSMFYIADAINNQSGNYPLWNYQNLTPYLNNTFPSGSLWHINARWAGSGSGLIDMNSSSKGNIWHDFFSTVLNSCTNTGWSCSALTNNETFIDSSCNITQNIYCGACGCGATQCNYPSAYGAYCDLTGAYTGNKYQGYYLNASDCSGTVTTRLCSGSLLCVNNFLVNGQNITNTVPHKIECQSDSPAETYIVNGTGAISTTIETAAQQAQGEPVNLGIIWLQSAIGTTGAFLISLIVSFGIGLIILFKSKRNGLPGFMVSMLISLGGFTYMGMFPQWFFVLAVAVIILGIYWSYKGGR